MSEIHLCVVDDHEQVLDSIRVLLEAADFEVHKFAAAEPLLTAIDAGDLPEIKCFVLDIRLPGMSGIDLQQELTKRHITAPVILISAHATREVETLGLKLGASTLLKKPFSGTDLVAAVETAMSNSPLDGGNDGTS